MATILGAGRCCVPVRCLPPGVERLMQALLLLLLLTLALSYWFVQPLAGLIRPLLTLSWLGWGLLVGLLWLFAGDRHEE